MDISALLEYTIRIGIVIYFIWIISLLVVFKTNVSFQPKYRKILIGFIVLSSMFLICSKIIEFMFRICHTPNAALYHIIVQGLPSVLLIIIALAISIVALKKINKVRIIKDEQKRLPNGKDTL
ncbi:hypothetical protein H6776_01725 [Candidatus Nomurabacteria bacterium]|nr:hypothetical protein [Candidatus Nomurabacteria bacterium]